MEVQPDRIQAGIVKRIRQACASCRRRKTKCSGERPVCFHCRRSRQRCVYEPYSMTVGDTNPVPTLPPPAQDNTAILQRLNLLESRLAELSDRAFPPSREHASEPNQSIMLPEPQTHNLMVPGGSPLRFNGAQFSLPPSSVLQSVIDTFFLHVHNRPYSYIQEASFRRKVDLGAVPNCLLLAVLASAVRFSTHEYYHEKKQEATEAYAKESWVSVLTEHLTVADSLTIEVVQTVNLLAIVDYTGGRVSSAWLKVGLAGRISQDLRLMIDPSDTLPFAEQEERRRVFWSGYLLDRLISCGKSRPLCFHDDDCHVRLPSGTESFEPGEEQKTHTLREVLCWDSQIDHIRTPSPFGLVILMASIFGRCTRYLHRESNPDKTPPWDTHSEFSKITSSLLLLESYSGSRQLSVTEILRDQESTKQPQAEQVIFAHTLFHLCQCLLNHPFLLRLRLKLFGSKVPTSFAMRVLQTCKEHSNQLLDLLHKASEAGFPLQSSFYPYCIAVVGGIQSLVFHYEISKNDARSPTTLSHFHQSLSILQRLGSTWIHAANMTIRLREFHAQGHLYSSLLDPTCIADDLDAASERILWSMVDYGMIGSSKSDGTISSDPSISNIPSPSSWILASDLFNTPSTEIMPGTDLNLAGGLTTCTPFNQGMDAFLHSC